METWIVTRNPIWAGSLTWTRESKATSDLPLSRNSQRKAAGSCQATLSPFPITAGSRVERSINHFQRRLTTGMELQCSGQTKGLTSCSVILDHTCFFLFQSRLPVNNVSLWITYKAFWWFESNMGVLFLNQETSKMCSRALVSCLENWFGDEYHKSKASWISAHSLVCFKSVCFTCQSTFFPGRFSSNRRSALLCLFFLWRWSSETKHHHCFHEESRPRCIWNLQKTFSPVFQHLTGIIHSSE